MELSKSEEELNDEYWMKRALELAHSAKHMGEIPVGAIIVSQGQILGEAFNEKERNQDATAHAEILAIKRASQYWRKWRLTGATLYVTLEPCFMCVGAIIASRLDRVVYGANDLKAGAIESTYKLQETKHFNHYPKITAGVLKEDCALIIKDFFKELRNAKK